MSGATLRDMASFRSVWRGLRHLVSRRAFEQELDDELRDYLARSLEGRLRAGATLDEAAQAMRREIGSVEATKEEVRGGVWEASVQTFARDLAYGARMLRRRPGFAVVVILMLALGIGATTAFISVANDVLWKRLPVDRPEQLALFTWTAGPRDAGPGMVAGMRIDPATGHRSSTAFSRLTFERFQTSTRTLSAVIAFAGQVRAFTADGRGWEAEGQLVSGNYFTALGVTPRLGRVIIADDDREDAEMVAVISHRYWLRRFGGDPAALGQTIRLDTAFARIVGVTPAAFTGTSQPGDVPDFSIALAMASRVGRSGAKFTGRLREPYVWALRLIGRLQPGATLDDARADLQGAFQETALEGWRANPRPQEGPVTPGAPQLHVESGSQGLSDWRRALTGAVGVLAIIVSLLLLIVCVNLTNLFLARAESRRHADRRTRARTACDTARSASNAAGDERDDDEA